MFTQRGWLKVEQVRWKISAPFHINIIPQMKHRVQQPVDDLNLNSGAVFAAVLPDESQTTQEAPPSSKSPALSMHRVHPLSRRDWLRLKPVRWKYLLLRDPRHRTGAFVRTGGFPGIGG
eukprot:GHVN01028035.1.p1 GENE.GHVN01028035.1~~GHVN01028035.1.p1  ORF type:complete len:119 (-),score=12.27 GHVN01028035.1:77-433(-)